MQSTASFRCKLVKMVPRAGFSDALSEKIAGLEIARCESVGKDVPL